MILSCFLLSSVLNLQFCCILSSCSWPLGGSSAKRRKRNTSGCVAALALALALAWPPAADRRWFPRTCRENRPSLGQNVLASGLHQRQTVRSGAADLLPPGRNRRPSVRTAGAEPDRPNLQLQQDRYEPAAAAAFILKLALMAIKQLKHTGERGFILKLNTQKFYFETQHSEALFWNSTLKGSIWKLILKRLYFETHH